MSSAVKGLVGFSAFDGAMGGAGAIYISSLDACAWHDPQRAVLLSSRLYRPTPLLIAMTSWICDVYTP